MKKLKVYLSVIVLSLLITSPILDASAQKLEGPVDFKLGTTHEMEIYTSSTLVWQEGKNELVTLNMTMTNYPTNVSTIEIQFVQIFSVEDTANAVPQAQVSNTTKISLSVTNSSYELDQMVPPPTVDRFYLNITFSAAPIGGNASQTYKLYSYRFPATDTIIIERDNLVPVINLYGFPPGSFFSNWLPIYGFMLFIMSVPAVIYGVSLVQEKRSSGKNGEKDSEDEESEGDDLDE